MPNIFRYYKEYLWSSFAAPRDRHLFQDVSAFCLWIGHGRSGHTLHGSLVNAHPEVCLGQELDALYYVERGLSRDQLYALILKRDRWFARQKSHWIEHDYAVPGQWQGRFRKLKVIGDRKAGLTTLRLKKAPHLLGELRQLVGVPLRIIHFTRNPFDNISTLARQSGHSLEHCANVYFDITRTNARLLQELDPAELRMMRHETFVANPRQELKRLIEFLGLAAEDQYLADCAEIVFPSPAKSRLKQKWTEPLIDSVQSEIVKYPYLKDYTYTS